MKVRNEFTVHMLNDQGKKKAVAIAEEFSAALTLLEALCGKDGREMAIVRTKMQEAAFYAKRAMAMNPENQQPVVETAPLDEPFIQSEKDHEKR